MRTYPTGEQALVFVEGHLGERKEYIIFVRSDTQRKHKAIVCRCKFIMYTVCGMITQGGNVMIKSKNEALSIMERYLQNGDDKLRSELYKFGERSGKLSKPDILMMWNGIRLSKFTPQKQAAIFEFLSQYIDLSTAQDFFIIKAPAPTGQVLPFDRKEEYLRTVANEETRAVYGSILRRAARNIETVYGKDLCELDAAELSAGVSEMGHTNTNTIRSNFALLKTYIKWCKDNGYFVPHWDKIDAMISPELAINRSLRSKLIKDAQTLQTMIFSTRDKEDTNTDSVILCLSWMGFTMDEIYDLKREDIHLETMSIRHPLLGSVTIPDEFRTIISRYDHSTEASSGLLTFVADESDYFIKRFVKPNQKRTGDRMSRSRLPILITKFARDYRELSGNDQKITAMNIFTSGACWRIYQREAGGETVTDELITEETRLSSERSIEAFRKIYQGYKEVFYQEYD